MGGDSTAQQALERLVNCEQEYVALLDFIVSECIPQLKPKLTQPESHTLFSNIEVIRAFHQMVAVEFVQQVSLPPDKQRIGSIFVKYGDFLKLYKTYSSTQVLGPNQPSEKLKNLKELQDMKFRGSTLAELLQLPTNRLSVYPALLKDLLAHLPASHADYDHLKQAISKIEEVQHWISNAPSDADLAVNTEKLRDIILGSETIQINGKLLKEDEFDRVKDNVTTHKYHYYLFSDMLMTAHHQKSKKGYRLHKVFYYNQTLVRSITSDPQFGIEVLDVETTKKYRFRMRSEEERKELVRFLQDSIFSQTIVWTNERANTFSWFYEDLGATEPLWEMALVYRVFQTSEEFLAQLEARFATRIDHIAVEILRVFMEGLRRNDLSAEAWTQLQDSLTKLIDKVPNLAAKTALLQTLENMKFIAPKTRRHALNIGEQHPEKSYRASVILQSPSSSLAKDKRPTISPAAVAEEITQTEWNILRCVNEAELLDSNWTRKNASDLAPNILAYIDRFNWTSHWISSKILRRDTPAKRVETLISYIDMGIKFKELNNFNGIMEVLSSLHSTPIYRLKETWSLVPPQKMADFQSLTDLMKPDKNSTLYREALAAVDHRAPCMPYLGQFLTDLVFIEEGNSKLVNGVVNPSYTSMMSTKLRAFKSYQQRKYKFMKPLYSIYGELIFGEEELYKLSKLREETSGPVEPAKLQMLRTESRRSKRASPIGMGTIPEDEEIAVDQFLSKRDWQILLSNSETKTLKKGEVLVQESEFNDNLFLVNSGMLKLNLAEGKEIDVGPGEMVSKVALVQTDQSFKSLVAHMDTTVTLINTVFLYRLFETEYELTARFHKYFSNQLNNTLRTLMLNYAQVVPARKRRSLMLSESIDPNDVDKVFGNIFKSLNNEVVLKSSPCKKGVFSGQLFVTKNYLCFSAKAFGLNKKKVTPLSTVSEIKIAKGTLEIFPENRPKPKRFVFRTEKEAEDLETILVSLWESARSGPQTIIRRGSDSNKEEDKSALTPDDWKLILKGTKCITYEPGTQIIVEGTRPTALCQIVKGVCSVQLKVGEKTTRIAERKEGEIFGELSFLDETQVASASVVADGPVEIYSLDYNYVHIILSVYKYLAPKFYRYIARLLWARIIEFLYRS